MDPVSLAAGASALLVTYLGRVGDQAASNLGDALAEAAVARLRQLHDWVKGKVAGRPVAERALQRLEEEPGDERRLVVFEDALVELIESDPAFADDLHRLVVDAAQASGPTFSNITDAGAIAGRDVNLRGRNVAGRDLTIGPSPAPDGER
jgi:hypothetical protein